MSPDGLCVVDKPSGWTSHDVVAKARGLLGTKKVGHAGTLDPDATGVLLLGVGRATRLLQYLSVLSKTYVGEVVLGVETTTLDAAGDVVATYDMDDVTFEQVRIASAAFVGAIDQVPPMVSALQVGGKRLYELARAGIEVERVPRAVTVQRYDVAPRLTDEAVFPIEVECSSGTYVRTLAADLGRALGGGAHLRALRRTAIGSFTLDEARPLDDLELLPPAAAVRHLVAVEVDDDGALSVATGRRLPRPEGGGPWAIMRDGALLAVYVASGDPADDRARAAVVLAAS